MSSGFGAWVRTPPDNATHATAIPKSHARNIVALPADDTTSLASRSQAGSRLRGHHVRDGQNARIAATMRSVALNDSDPSTIAAIRSMPPWARILSDMG